MRLASKLFGHFIEMFYAYGEEITNWFYESIQWISHATFLFRSSEHEIAH